jgi:hypothetical protein
MPRTPEEKKRAIRQVEADGPTPMCELVLVAGADERSLIRWATDGRSGCYLDAICRRGKWFSSREAVARFVRAVAVTEEWLEEEAAEKRARGRWPAGEAPVTRPGRPAPTAAPANR